MLCQGDTHSKRHPLRAYSIPACLSKPEMWVGVGPQVDARIGQQSDLREAARREILYNPNVMEVAL